jgi:hypothetical protein
LPSFASSAVAYPLKAIPVTAAASKPRRTAFAVKLMELILVSLMFLSARNI